MKNLRDRIYECVALIPFGKVVTVKELAGTCCKFRIGRMVKKEIKKMINEKNIPWHRVVENNGLLLKNINIKERKEQQDLLINEGVETIKGKVDLYKYAFYYW